jgi:hypothetical protein
MGVCGREEEICFRNTLKGDLDFCESAVLGRGLLAVEIWIG